ncbi:hypothetical protein OS493_039966 [Desmophyllum pertusum]|uniref:Uncharacterized protein n=1 Tax=Desmophyllum pertusum TaxID=174260 RepID=A0A9W9ZKE3_9CNID|nr:hypothetical protein OS493_039966 [Desmophyllum pertusum]
MDKHIKQKNKKMIKRKLRPSESTIDKASKEKKHKGTKKAQDMITDLSEGMEKPVDKGSDPTILSNGEGLEPAAAKKEKRSYESVSLQEDVAVPDSTELSPLKNV